MFYHKKEEKHFHASLTPVDIAAIFCFAALACYLFIAVRYGIGVVDEGFYLTIPHRLLQGDSLLTDEWHLSQLSSFFQMIPVKLFVTITGGTEGIILFMRNYFVVCWVSVFFIAYVTLRRFGVAALIGSVLAAFTVPVNIPAVNYYSGLIMSSVLLCCLLFWKEKKELRPAEFVLCGILLSCMVLNDPLDAVIYFIYSAAVLIEMLCVRRKKSIAGDFTYFIDLKAWVFITAGILLSMAVVFGFILSRTDISTVLNGLPELFTDSEYDFSSGGVGLAEASRSSVFSLSLLFSEIKAMGTAHVIAFSALCAAGLYFRKHNKTVNAILLLCAAVLMAVMAAVYQKGDPQQINQVTCINFPKVFCGVMLLAFTEKHDRRLTLSVLLIFFASAIRDISSDITLGITVCACIPVFAVFCEKLGRELFAFLSREDTKAEIKRFPMKLLRTVCLSVLAASILVTSSVSVATSLRMETLFEKTFFYIPSDTSRETLESGPLKGIRTFGKLSRTYELIVDDLEQIRENCSGPVYVADLDAWYYLCLDRPYGTYSAWYVKEDSQTRQYHYWEKYPERRPEYIYIPKIDCYSFKSITAGIDDKLSFIRGLCECEVTESPVGVTVHVTSWS